MSPRSRLLIAVVSTGFVGYIAVGSLLGRVMGDSTYGQLAVFNEVVKMVIDAYVEPVNLDRTLAGARLGLMDALDGDSAYLDAEELKAYQQPAKDADADVGMLLTRRFAFLMVVSVRDGSPAQRAGLRPGDALKTIDGRHTRPLAAPIGQRLLRGAPGSVVKLSVLRGSNDPLEFSLVRERLQPLPPQGRMLEERTGYLRVAEMPGRTADEVRGQLEALKKAGARNLVLDLRASGYGVPEEGARVAELFLKGGVVGKLAGAHDGERLISADVARTAWDLPLAVLVDNGTAGPAEIAAAALLESERASLVGEHTFGRAALQKVVPLAEGGGLLVTTAKYLTPKGNAIHGRGLTPDVPVEAPEDQQEEQEQPGAGADPILDKALELLRAEVKKAA